MRYLLFTSDRYVDLVAEQAILNNKFSSVKREVEVLGFNPPTVEYPSNYKFISLGKQEDFPGKNWSDPIREYIEGIEEEGFLLHWDDLFAIGPTREELLDEAIQLVLEGKAQKVHFFMGARDQYMQAGSYNENFIEMSQDATYRTGLAPGVWSKDYFLKYLKPGMTSWDYEVNNMKLAMYDGATILLPKSEPISPWINMYVKGEFNYKHLEQMMESKSGRHFGWNKFQVLEEKEYKMFLKHRGITL
jgi:hypothetical protein